jgi:hypothetical protein
MPPGPEWGLARLIDPLRSHTCERGKGGKGEGCTPRGRVCYRQAVTVKGRGVCGPLDKMDDDQGQRRAKSERLNLERAPATCEKNIFKLNKHQQAETHDTGNPRSRISATRHSELPSVVLAQRSGHPTPAVLPCSGAHSPDTSYDHPLKHPSVPAYFLGACRTNQYCCTVLTSRMLRNA